MPIGTNHPLNITMRNPGHELSRLAYLFSSINEGPISVSAGMFVAVIPKHVVRRRLFSIDEPFHELIEPVQHLLYPLVVTLQPQDHRPLGRRLPDHDGRSTLRPQRQHLKHELRYVRRQYIHRQFQHFADAEQILVVVVALLD